MAITDWPAAERPREKLPEKGARALSDAELIAIYLRNGARGRSAVELARDLLTKFGGIRGNFGTDRKSLCAVRGIGETK